MTQKQIAINGFEIIINCNEVINLFLHTLNIYGLLGYHGTQYKLRQHEGVINSIDKKIREDVKEGDRYYSYGNLNIYVPSMNYIMDNETWKNPISAENIHMGNKQMQPAFQKSWDEFYKDYWHNTNDERAKLFHDCVNAFDFAEAAKKMSFATHTEFPKEIYIFPAEASAGSGLKFSDNVCMGDLFVGGDMGFVHEGLHLLLQENWARNDEIIKFMNVSNYNDKNYGSWAAKYEQILVVGLDCCIRDFEDERAKKYYQGCGVSNEFNIAYPLIKSYYQNGCKEPIENVMLKIIKQTKTDLKGWRYCDYIE
ncbi:MAG: hypothetical protein FWC89_10380 [Defluviitaleaceae bacterium]|nr:hypothetical protein [Defluviitaleaceae bacterium]